MSKNKAASSTAKPAAGFTLFELVLVVAVLGMIVAIVAPRVAPILSRSGAGHAVSVLANDLEQAVSLAGRQRKPVRIACDCAAGIVSVTDRASGAVLFHRLVTGPNAGFGVTQLSLAPAIVDVFPSGLTSSPLTITVGAAGVTRQVTMTTAGFVRIIR